jgi:hypothetical protein
MMMMIEFFFVCYEKRKEKKDWRRMRRMRVSVCVGRRRRKE